jgi:Leucine-rich repeat (LRR) protein
MSTDVHLAFIKKGFVEITEDTRQAIFGVENLESLDFSSNAITEVPLEILELATLKKLNLFNNRLSVISSASSHCLNLDLGANLLTTMPQGFPDLISLNLDWNLLKSLI